MKLRNHSVLYSLTALAFFGAIAATLGMTRQPSAPDVAQGAAAPSFSATTMTGETLRFPGALQGKPSVVLMWSTWCPYCKVLMPRLGKIQAQYGVEVIAINAKERGIGDPKAFMREAGYEFTNILDGDEIAASFDVEYLPGLFVVGPSGNIVYRRGWTDLDPGQTVADLWEKEVAVAVQSATKEFTD